MKHSPHCLFLIETKSNKLRMQRVAMMLGFKHYEIVEAKGLAGSLALMWIDQLKMNTLWKNDHFICASIQDVGLQKS